MIIRARFIISVLSLVLLSLACGLLSPSPSTTPDVQPSAPADVPDAPLVTELPLLPSGKSNLPVGLVTATENTLILYDSGGTELSRIAFPQLSFGDRSRVHIAGPMPPKGGVVPLLYFSFGANESLHYRDGAGQIFTLQNGTSYLGLTGVPGQPIVAFTQADYLDTQLRSNIYVGSVQTLPSAAPVGVIDDPESWSVKPILVRAENDTPTQVWYTRMAYGIGGDIVFEPRKGLFMLDIATGQANTILDNNVAPWDISTDRNWVAFSKAETPANSMCAKNLQTGSDLCFSSLPASNPRGAGNGYFSPDTQYIAWMEGDGWQMAEVPNFKATVRVGQNNGTIIADLPMNSFESVAGIPLISHADPVAWLDIQTVIVQVRGQDWDESRLMQYDVLSRETSYLAPGEFVGLLYP